MIKSEKQFMELKGELEIGKPCIIKLMTGELAKTSTIEDFYISHNGDIKIVTHNSIYRKDCSKSPISEFEQRMIDNYFNISEFQSKSR